MVIDDGGVPGVAQIVISFTADECFMVRDVSIVGCCKLPGE